LKNRNKPSKDEKFKKNSKKKKFKKKLTAFDELMIDNCVNHHQSMILSFGFQC